MNAVSLLQGSQSVNIGNRQALSRAAFDLQREMKRGLIDMGNRAADR
jgi:hypothetical protein